MASVIKAGNATDGVQVTSDNTGILELKTGTGSGTTAMTLDASQNVGIGTSSPTNLLSVAGNANFTGNVTLGDASTDTVTVNGYMGVGANPVASYGLFVAPSSLTGTTQQGLRVLPTGTSAATSSISGVVAGAYTQAASYTVGSATAFFAADSVKGAGSTITNQHGIQISDQTQGTNNYGITSLVSSGSNKWNIYASGTAQNYFAGNVGIGTTSPAARLDVNTGGASNTMARFTSNGSYYTYILSSGVTSVFSADTSGNNAIQIRGASNQIEFNTNSTERARITSGGNLLVGSTTDDARLRVNGTAVVGRFVADGGGYANDVVLIDTSGTAAGTGFDLIQANSGGAVQFRVRGDGTIFAQNTTVQSASDFRIKENIRDSEEGLAVVTALRPVRFDFKEGFGNDKKNQLGFIAQEMEQVFPDAVDVAAKEETDDENAEPYKTVGAAALIPVLVKAIQELNAKVEAQAAEIAALKGAAQ